MFRIVARANRRPREPVRRTLWSARSSAGESRQAWGSQISKVCPCCISMALGSGTIPGLSGTFDCGQPARSIRPRKTGRMVNKRFMVCSVKAAGPASPQSAGQHGLVKLPSDYREGLHAAAGTSRRGLSAPRPSSCDSGPTRRPRQRGDDAVHGQAARRREAAVVRLVCRLQAVLWQPRHTGVGPCRSGR